MVALSAFFKDQELADARKNHHLASAEYELALRKEVYAHLNGCPDCFKGMYSEFKDYIVEDYSSQKLEPSDVEVLEWMRRYLEKAKADTKEAE